MTEAGFWLIWFISGFFANICVAWFVSRKLRVGGLLLSLVFSFVGPLIAFCFFLGILIALWSDWAKQTNFFDIVLVGESDEKSND
jgi:fructose-specific phosphotransferase system IIC component